MNSAINFFSFATFFIIPFLGGNHLALFYVTIDKFWIETSFVLLLLVAILLNFYKNRVCPSGFLRFLLFFLPFLLINVASFFYTWNRFNTLNELNAFAWIIGCVYLYHISKIRNRLLKALLFGGAISVLCMIIQYTILLPNLMEIFKDGRYASIIKGKAVPFSSFLNDGTLGGYFLFLIPLGIYFGIIQKKTLHTVMTFIIVFGLLFSLSRMGIMLALLSIFASFFIIVKKRGFKGIMLLVLIVISASAMFLFFTYGGNKGSNVQFLSRASDRVKNLSGHITTLNARTAIWKISVDTFFAKPLSGYGAGTFEYAYKKYYDAGFYTRSAHSAIVKIIVELGLLGLLSFLFYLFGFMAYTSKSIKNIGKDTENLFIALSVLSGCIFAVFNVTFEAPAYIITFFVLSSVFFIVDHNPENVVKKGALKEASPTIIFLFVVVVLMGSFFFTTKADMSEKLNEEGRFYMENGLLPQALVSYKEAVNAMPLNNRGYVGLISTLLRSYQIEKNVRQKELLKNEIIQNFKKVEYNTDKDPELFFLTGSMFLLLGNMEKAEEYFNRAMEYHPSSGYYMYETANFYFSKGDISKAKAVIARMKGYIDRHTGSSMHGIYVYKMRNLESNIEYMNGNVKNALEMARKNLEDAKKDENIIENILAREYVIKESFIKYLSDKVMLYESKARASK